MNIDEYRKTLNGKTIAVIGLGISNVPLIKFLSKSDSYIYALDKRSAEELADTLNELRPLGVNFILGEDYLDKIPPEADMIFKTPGLRFDVPQLEKARQNGAIVTSDTELFFELCPAEIIGVTGSDGKTTTTTLIYEMLKKEGYKTFACGNIGNPLFKDLEKISAGDKVVLELSSFQLHTLKKSPLISVITNITPNHLNWHIDYNEYIEAKKNIFKYQNSGGITVLNADNEITKSFSSICQNPVLFSRKERLKDGICLDGKMISKFKNGAKSEEMLDIDKIRIPGMHNVENYMAAIAALDGLVSIETIKYVAENFGGVPHRIEFVRELRGVKYYNDSIASTPARTAAGLISFKQKLILIAGGYDKNISYTEFGEVVCENVKKLVLVGDTSEKIKNAVLSAKNYTGLPIYEFKNFEEAVNCAKDISEAGDVVILSPASASFDMFKNFEERGNIFKKIVNSF